MRFLAVAGVSLLFACAGPGEEGEAGSDPAPAPPSAPASNLTLDDFRTLRFLEGRWKGELPNGGSFYESYKIVNDSTIQMYAHADGTFGAPTDSSRIHLTNGTIVSESPTSRWNVSNVRDSVVFRSTQNAGNSFSWRSTGPDSWTARLDNNGTIVVYELQRVR